jgi:DNA-binding MarR family transcriptional regulator
LYEQALRPLGVRATQFTILQVLARAGEVSQGELGEMLAMDTTTLTRTLEIMRRQGWITQRRGADRRQRFLRLGKRGQVLLERGQPVWEELQSRLRHRLGEKTWDHLLQLTNQVASLVENQGDQL